MLFRRYTEHDFSREASSKSYMLTSPSREPLWVLCELECYRICKIEMDKGVVTKIRILSMTEWEMVTACCLSSDYMSTVHESSV